MFIKTLINAEKAYEFRGAAGNNIRLRKINPIICEIYDYSTNTLIAKGFFFKKFKDAMWRIMIDDFTDKKFPILQADRIGFKTNKYDFVTLAKF